MSERSQEVAVRAFAVDQFGALGSDLPVPEPEDGYVRVRVAAAGINPADIGALKGYYKDQMEHRFPPDSGPGLRRNHRRSRCRS